LQHAGVWPSGDTLANWEPPGTDRGFWVLIGPAPDAGIRPIGTIFAPNLAPPRHVSARTRRRRRRQLRSIAQLAAIVAAVVFLMHLNGRPSSASGVVIAGGVKSTTAKKGSSTSTTPTAPTTTPATSVAASPTTLPAAGPAAVMASPAVTKYLSGRHGTITAAVYDVAAKTTSLLHPSVTEQTASIEKVDILATLLEDDQEQGAAVSASDNSRATDMIEHSDNDAAQDLWDEVGEDYGVGLFNRSVGMSGTVLGTAGYWGVTTTTAADQVRLLEAVVLPGPVLDPASQGYELSLMEHVEADQAWGVSGGVAAGATLALKNGWVTVDGDDWQVNSMGWIDGDGRDYLLAVLTDQDPTESYGITTIEGLSSLVWSELAA
jgi:Beta-lactamase enzyme family